MWIDLTKTITNDMKIYHDDPKTNLIQEKTVDVDGYSLYRLSMGLHSGTHIDGQRHMLTEGEWIDEVDPNRFIGKAIVIDASRVSNLSNELLTVSNIDRVDMVFVYGGSSETVILKSFAHALIEHNISILGIDFDSPDKEPYDIHKLLLQNNILIVEQLCCLKQLLTSETIDVVIAPLKIHADSTPVRVFANITKPKS